MRGAESSVLVDDKDVVYTTGDALMTVPFAGGAPEKVADLVGPAAGSRAKYRMFDHGRVAIVYPRSGGPATLWSRSAGARSIDGMVFSDDTENIAGIPTDSGDHVVVLRDESSRAALTNEKRWWVDVATLDAVEIVPPVEGRVRGCVPRGERVACVSVTKDATTVWLVDGSGVKSRATLSEAALQFTTLVEGDGTLLVRSRDHIFAIDLDGVGEPRVLAGSTAGMVALQGGWLAFSMPFSTPSEVHALRLDGSQEKVLSDDGYLANMGTSSVDTRRIRWAPICTPDGENGKDLRVVDPATNKTVEVSKSCVLDAITYSDNYAFIEDDWVATPDDPVSGGSGIPRVVDLRDGSKRANPTKHNQFHVYPIAKSRVLALYNQYASNYEVSYFDGHTSAATPSAVLPNNEGGGFRVLKNGAQAMTRNIVNTNFLPHDIYRLSF